jgi:hypothetical protein
MNDFSKAVAKACIGMFLVLAGSLSYTYAADKKGTAVDKNQNNAKKDIKQIIFEEQKIEGKIRRPQMVLIKADQRPALSSMVLASLGRNDNIAEFVDQAVIEKTPNQEAFQFEGTRISNYVK